MIVASTPLEAQKHKHLVEALCLCFLVACPEFLNLSQLGQRMQRGEFFLSIRREQ